MRCLVQRIAAGLVLLTCSLFATASYAGNLPDTTGAFYAISVQNLDDSIAWYTTHLGFELCSQAENDQRRGALLERPGALLELAEFDGAVSRTALKPGLESHLIHGIFKLGFVANDLDKTYAVLSEAGVEVFFPIVTASDGRRTFGVLDPDGNIVQFFGD